MMGGARRLDGLSPRMRGNLAYQPAEYMAPGSIPAHAGQPQKYLDKHFAPPVYPRACGATRFREGVERRLLGLSPRMRGNPRWRRVIGKSCRSIPAHAGQPRPSPRSLYGSMVYPRACGATTSRAAFLARLAGLSPRMRGNRKRLRRQQVGCRSIPAHAGQPLPTICYGSLGQVYPRACGATSQRRPTPSAPTGLSPRMRGNHRLAPCAIAYLRSIPAHAGQPCPRCDAKLWLKVYPRACGATANSGRSHRYVDGLSPRMRGNLARSSTSCSTARSIPAHAGQPLTRYSLILQI